MSTRQIVSTRALFLCCAAVYILACSVVPRALADPYTDVGSPLLDIAIDTLPPGLLFESVGLAKGGVDDFYEALFSSPDVGLNDPNGPAIRYCEKMFSAIERHALWLKDIELVSDPFTAKAGLANALNGAAFIVRYNSLNKLIRNESVPRESRMMYSFALAQESYGFMAGRIEALSPVMMGFTFVPNAICQVMIGEAANAIQSTHQALDIYNTLLENRFFAGGQPEWFKSRMGLQALYVEETGYGSYQPLWRQLVADFLIYTNEPYVVRYDDPTAFLGMKYRHSGSILKSGVASPQAKSVTICLAPLYLYSKDFQGGWGQSSFDVDVTYRVAGVDGCSETIGIQHVSSIYPEIVNSFDPSASEIALPSYLFGTNAVLEVQLEFAVPASAFAGQRGPTGTVVRIPLDASITGDTTPPSFSWTQARRVSAGSIGPVLELSCAADDPESSIDSVEVQVKTAEGAWTNLVERHFGKRVYVNPLSAPAATDVRGRARNLVGALSAWSTYHWVEGTPLINPSTGTITPGQQVLSPPHGATNVSAQVTLTWAESEAQSHDLYLGISPESMSLVAGGLFFPSFTTNLNPNTSYFWQVVTHQGGTDVPGPVWTFTTGSGGTSGSWVAPEIVSLRSDGTQTQADSRDAVMSRDGRFVVFACDDAGVDKALANTAKQVFLRDRVAGTTSQISVGVSNGPPNAASYAPAISRDGQFVTFASAASNLVAGVNNGMAQVFRASVPDRAVQLVSRNGAGGACNGVCDRSCVSSSGRYVVFSSAATDLAGPDNNGTWDVFLRDMQSGSVFLVSKTPSGASANGPSQLKGLTPDGRFVLFESVATDIIGGVNNGMWQVYRFDRQSDSVKLVSVSTTGRGGNGSSYAGDVSDNGQYVCFTSEASDLIPAPPYCRPQVYLRDIGMGTTELLSLPEAVGQSGPTFTPAVSENGEWITFTALAWGNVDPFAPQVVRYDRRAGVYEIVSLTSAGQTGNGRSVGTATVYGNRLIAMRTEASDLVPSDSNSRADIVLYDLSGISRYRIAGSCGVAYAQVTASGSGSVTVQSDASGNYLFNGLAEGTWTIQASASGFDFTSAEVDLCGSDEASVNLAATPSRTHLTVEAAGATASPNDGTHEYDVGSMLTVIASPSEPVGGVRTVPAGWTGNGSVPPVGSGSSCRFQITQESALIWQTTNEYCVAVVWGLTNSTWGSATNWLRLRQALHLEMPSLNGYDFNGWFCGTNLVTNSVILDAVITNPVSLAAYYRPVDGVAIGGCTVLPGVTVSFTGLVAGVVQSDAAGFYSITNLIAGAYTLKAEKPGYSFTDSPRIVSYIGLQLTEDFAPTLLPGTYNLAGNCVVSGAIINVSGPVDTNLVSDFSGAFSLGALPNGTYTVSVVRTGYCFLPAAESVQIENSSWFDVKVWPQVLAPTVTPPSGGYPYPLEVVLSEAAPEATIHYTIDGSTPSTNSPVYAGPVQIDRDASLRAIAHVQGLQSSPLVVAVYNAGLRITEVGRRTRIGDADYLPITFHSISNQAYILQVASNVSGPWMTVSDSLVAITNRMQVLVRMLDSMPQCFYRILTTLRNEAYSFTFGFNLPDQWISEFAWESLPAERQGLRNAADDPDGDGMDNQSEMAAGTDPTDPSSCLKMLSIQTTGGVLSGAVQSTTGHVYYVESMSSDDAVWRPVTGLISGGNDTFQWQVLRDPDAKAVFYRAILVVPSDMTKVVP